MLWIESLTHLCDLPIMAVGTICTLQARELHTLYVCDASWEHYCLDTLMLCIKLLKQAKEREGLYPNTHQHSLRTALDMLKLLQLYLKWERLILCRELQSCSPN